MIACPAVPPRVPPPPPPTHTPCALDPLRRWWDDGAMSEPSVRRLDEVVEDVLEELMEEEVPPARGALPRDSGTSAPALDGGTRRRGVGVEMSSAGAQFACWYTVVACKPPHRPSRLPGAGPTAAPLLPPWLLPIPAPVPAAAAAAATLRKTSGVTGM